MTKGECKQIMDLLDAISVPDTAEIKAGSISLQSAAFFLDGPGINYAEDGEGHWNSSPGNPNTATAVVLAPVV